MRAKLIEPTKEEILRFCAEAPGRAGVPGGCRASRERQVYRTPRGRRGPAALCHLGTNIVPSGEGCAAFAGVAAKIGPRMLIGEERAVSELWEAGRRRFGGPARTGRISPSTRCGSHPSRSVRASSGDARRSRLSPPRLRGGARRGARDRPAARDAPSYRWRTRVQIEEGRSWLWDENGVIQFKAEASAWTPSVVQLQQVWVDPPARRRGQAARGLRDLARLLLRDAEVVCLFVRRENEPAIRLYESIGMKRVLSYRSVLLCGN